MNAHPSINAVCVIELAIPRFESDTRLIKTLDWIGFAAFIKACLNKKLMDAIANILVNPVNSRKGKESIWKHITAFTDPIRPASEGPISIDTIVIICPSEISRPTVLSETAKRLVKYRFK